MATWQLLQNKAQCRGHQLSFDCELAYPNRGMHGIRWQGTTLTPQTLLGISPFPTTPDAGESVADAYTRGDDLVVRYAQTSQRSVEFRAYWRWVRPTAEIEGVELIVSVQTSRLESDPRLVAVTAWPEAECFGYAAGQEGLASLGDSQDVATPERPYVVWRPPGGEVSFAQIVHPTDFQWASLNPRGQVQFGLIPESLEKGVIRTVRIQGLFLPRKDDAPNVQRCVELMFRHAPPLTA